MAYLYKIDPQFYHGNYHYSTHPTHNRESYYSLRSQVRKWRRQGIARMDVLWYAPSLGIEPYTTEVTRREAYDWGSKTWYTVPRLCSPRLHWGLRVAVNACVGRLP